MNSTKTADMIDSREIRRKLGLNQQQFWSMLGVTQSGGSRYESSATCQNRSVNCSYLVHIEQIDLQRVKRDDMRLIAYLKSEDSALYKTLKKSAKAWKKSAKRSRPYSSEIGNNTNPQRSNPIGKPLKDLWRKRRQPVRIWL